MRAFQFIVRLLSLLLVLIVAFSHSLAAAASFTITPSLTSISRSRAVTIHGTGTAWTTGTTFSVSGGIATLTGVSVNASTQIASATWNPGPIAGTFTVSDSTDANTYPVSVGTSQTFSGSNLTSYTASPTYVFDATNEFPSDIVGHVLVVSGGTGFLAGPYTANAVLMNHSLTGGQGIHNIVKLCALGSNTVGAASGAASGGSYSWFMGQGGDGFSGTNLISWFNSGSKPNPGSYSYDPDATLSPSLNGSILTIDDGGIGATPGSYTAMSFTTNSVTGDAGTQNVIRFQTVPGQQGWYGYPWMQSGGVIPTATVNTAYTGAINVLLIGDSITRGQGGTTASALATEYPNASSIGVLNEGISGALSSEWLIGSSKGYLNTAIAAANSAGTTVAFIMLGTNDAFQLYSVATHTANIQAITNSLFADIPTLTAVVLMEQPAVGSVITGYASYNATIHSYFASYNTVSGAIQGWSSTATATISSFYFFSTYQQYTSDGVHPTAIGQPEINYTWLTSAASSITGTP